MLVCLFYSALAVLWPSGSSAACSQTVTSLDCSTKSDGIYPLKLEVSAGKYLFPEVYCEDNQLTILKRTRAVTPKSSFRDKNELDFRYNQGTIFFIVEQLITLR